MRQQLDSTRDGTFGLNDINYLLLAVAGKYRFVASYTAGCPRQSAGELEGA